MDGLPDMSMLRFKAKAGSLLLSVKRFFRENPGAVFIVGFQVSLVACAIMLVLGMGVLAEGVAVVAYFLIVTGVVVQLVLFLKKRDGDSSG